MATHTGSEGIVKFATSGGSVAQVAEVRSYTLEQSADTIETTSMGDSSRSYTSALKTFTISMECYWDETDTTGQGVIDVSTEVDFELYPEGTASGDTYYSGSAIVTGVSTTASFDGNVEVSFSAQGTGALTETTVS
jgi:predicted secreted protein